MKWITFHRIIVSAIAIAFYFGCAEHSFYKEEAENHCQESDVDCNNVVASGQTKVIDPGPVSIPGGVVDVIFVVDNSNSMSTEQKRMALAFNNFINNLEDYQKDYRVGIITTDVSASPGNSLKTSANGQGAFQDGKLIQFVNSSGSQSGNYYLTSSISQRVDLFESTIQRKETIQCENWLMSGSTLSLYNSDRTQYAKQLQQNCPSGDERGVYALNLFLQNEASKMLRPKAHLAVIIVSDENERSSGGALSGYPLESLDKPQTFVDNFKAKYEGDKTLSVHSVIIKDEACRVAQSGQDGGITQKRGYIGTVYSELSNLTSGIVGDVCANDYTNQLQDIGYSIIEQVVSLNLECSDPINFQIQFIPSSAQVGYRIEGSKLIFDQNAVPGSKVDLRYECKVK